MHFQQQGNTGSYHLSMDEIMLSIHFRGASEAKHHKGINLSIIRLSIRPSICHALLLLVFTEIFLYFVLIINDVFSI